jgi:hypothetical protein
MTKNLESSIVIIFTLFQNNMLCGNTVSTPYFSCLMLTHPTSGLISLLFAKCVPSADSVRVPATGANCFGSSPFQTRPGACLRRHATLRATSTRVNADDWLCIFRSNFPCLLLLISGCGQHFSNIFHDHPRPGDVLQQLVLKRTDQVLPHYIVHLEPRRAVPAVAAPAPAPNVAAYNAAYNAAYQQQLALLRQQLQPAIQPTKVKGKRGRRW